MANALGKLFTDIAAAIRGKTGESGTMKPLEFPEKIAGIEAGGGGGSLPAGLYWEQLVPNSTSYSLNYFVFNGEVYLFQSTASSGWTRNICKLENGAFKTLQSGITAYIPGSCNGWELNGKLHILGGAYSNHYTWDGTTLTRMNDLPFAPNSEHSVVMGGELYALKESDGTFYKWIESSDSWELAAFTMGAGGTSGKLFFHDGDLYQLSAGKLYLCDGTTRTLVVDFADFRYQALFCYHKGLLYMAASTGKGCYEIEVYDIDKAERRVLGMMPYLGSGYRVYEYEGKIRVGGGQNTGRMHLVMHEVTE